MSYAIIINTNYKMKNLPGIYRHNERKNTNYSNKDIDKTKSKENYSIKSPSTTYTKLFKQIKELYNLKGQIKSVSNVACEYIITSDKDFFDNIGKEETKRFFKSAYSFVCNQKQENLSLRKRIKDKDALKIVFDIIDIEEKGLSISAMTSQILAIFFLNDIDHFIKETLKIKYFLRYQDDFLLFHPSKQYLKYCLNELEKFLEKEKLTLNKKTRIYKSTNKFIFLGRKPNGNYAKFRDVRRKIKKRIYLYRTGQIQLSGLISSIICYKHLCKKGSNY